MLGHSAISTHAISEVPVRTVTPSDMACLDPQHEVLWRLTPQHEVLWELALDHALLWTLDPRIERECD